MTPNDAAVPGSVPPVHASCVALPPTGGRGTPCWRGVLLRGPSAVGKSSAALALIQAADARLVADDRVLLLPAGTGPLALPPASLAGLIEVRGLGIVRTPYRAPVTVALAVDMVPPETAESLDRIPEPDTAILVGCPVPLVRMAWPDPCFAARILAALERV